MPILSEQSVEINTIDDTSLLQLYREIWGHQDKRHVQNIMARELGINAPLGRELCELCTYSKAYRLPFEHKEKSFKSGELMSADRSTNLFKRRDTLFASKIAIDSFAIVIL